MKNFDTIKKQWKAAKKTKAPVSSTKDLLRKAQINYSKTKRLHRLNILILSCTCLGISAFFYFVAPMQDALSRTGIVFMIGALLVRIIIEMFSHQKASKISYNTDLTDSAEHAASFYNWRKKIHGPVTITIIMFYTIGFYVLTPEFSRYLDIKWLIAFDISYLLAAVFLFFQIRKGIRKEMHHLQEIKEIRESLVESI